MGDQSSRQSSLPEYEVVIQRNRMIPMRDGVSLATDVYLPARSGVALEGPWATLLTRTPYNKLGFAVDCEWWASRGYACVVQDVRGRFASQGDFYLLKNEAEDGYDTIEWLAEQPWSTGKIGTMGTSYMGWVQSAAPIGNVGQPGRVQRPDVVAAPGRRVGAALAGLGVLERAGQSRGGTRSVALHGARPGRGRSARLPRSVALAFGRHAALADPGLRTLGDRPFDAGSRGRLAVGAAIDEFRTLHRSDRRRAQRLLGRLVRQLHAGDDGVVHGVLGGDGIATVPAHGSVDTRRSDARPHVVGRRRLRPDCADLWQPGPEHLGSTAAVLRPRAQGLGQRLVGDAAGQDVRDGRRQRSSDRVGSDGSRRRMAGRIQLAAVGGRAVGLVPATGRRPRQRAGRRGRRFDQLSVRPQASRSVDLGECLLAARVRAGGSNAEVADLAADAALAGADPAGRRGSADQTRRDGRGAAVPANRDALGRALVPHGAAGRGCRGERSGDGASVRVVERVGHGFHRRAARLLSAQRRLSRGLPPAHLGQHQASALPQRLRRRGLRLAGRCGRGDDRALPDIERVRVRASDWRGDLVVELPKVRRQSQHGRTVGSAHANQDRTEHRPPQRGSGVAGGVVGGFGIGPTQHRHSLSYRKMPTVLRDGSFRYYFLSGDRGEPPHVHVQRDDGFAKV